MDRLTEAEIVTFFEGVGNLPSISDQVANVRSAVKMWPTLTGSEEYMEWADFMGSDLAPAVDALIAAENRG